MILYDKSGLFLGMGSQELYLLGYEDMEEFRNYHTDFADLFVNKPGFIFKFKNFCWIDYAQHSGTPNKRILIRTKNGKEIESSLTIHEIYLQKEINGTSLFYGVELSSAAAFKRDLPLSSTPPSPIFEPESLSEEPSMFPSYEASSEQEHPASFLSQPHDEPTLPTLNASFEEESPYTEPLSTPMISLPEEESSYDFKLNTPTPAPEETFDFKLKFDQSILEEPSVKEEPHHFEKEPSSTYQSIDQITLSDLDFVAPVESYPDDNVEDLLEDPTLHVDELRTFAKPATETLKPFDLSECAENLGLDLGTLAQILEEYASALSSSMPRLEQAINANNRNGAHEEIATLKNVALHLQVLTLIHHFEHLESSLQFDTKEEIFHTLRGLQKAVDAFKKNLL